MFHNPNSFAFCRLNRINLTVVQFSFQSSKNSAHKSLRTSWSWAGPSSVSDQLSLFVKILNLVVARYCYHKKQVRQHCNQAKSDKGSNHLLINCAWIECIYVCIDGQTYLPMTLSWRDYTSIFGMERWIGVRGWLDG